MRLRARAPAKVNLCLFLGPSRPDGRHELLTLFESVSVWDELTLTPLPEENRDRVVCPQVPGENLVVRAVELLRESGWNAPPVQIEIQKRIPIAAGMGGGSADAAAALRMAQRLGSADVGEVAKQLGADVPSQLEPGLVLGTGAGDVVEPVSPLAQRAFVVIPQDARLSTAEVYREADRMDLPREAQELDALRRELVSALRQPDKRIPQRRIPPHLIVNDLEPAARALCPPVADAIRDSRARDPDSVLVCGSGPTVVGLWWGAGAREHAESAARALAASYPGTTAAIPVAAPFGAPKGW